MTDLHNWVLEDIGKSKCDIQLSKKELKIDFLEYLCRFKKYINGDNGLKIAAWIKYTQPRIQGSFWKSTSASIFTVVVSRTQTEKSRSWHDQWLGYKKINLGHLNFNVLMQINGQIRYLELSFKEANSAIGIYFT